MAQFDVIVIGGGLNGLTAAAFLARAGRRVVVLEREASVGGLARRIEFHPGYSVAGLLHATCNVRWDLLRPLRLERYGLTRSPQPAPVALLSHDGRSISLSADLGATAHSIAAVSSKDAAAYRRYRKFCDKVKPWLATLFDRPLPPYAASASQGLLRLLERAIGVRRLGRDTMQELLQVAPMSVADFLDEYFETDILKAGLALPAVQATFGGPMSSLTTLNLLLHEVTLDRPVLGGPPALAAALEQACIATGVSIRTNSEVTQVLLARDGSARGVTLANGEDILGGSVAAACAPQEALYRLMDRRGHAVNVDQEFQLYRCRGHVAHVALALRGKAPWKAGPVTYARCAPSLLAIEQAFDAVKYGAPSASPILDIAVHTAVDSTVAPDGHDVISALVHYVPGANNITWTREDVVERVLAALASHTVGLRELLVHVQLSTPHDLMVRYRLPGGHLWHGEHAIDQLLCRPTLRCAGYRTPTAGLYLCGSGAPPGGGLTCGPGALAAGTILSAR